MPLELNSLLKPGVITSNRKSTMKLFPQGLPLNKAYDWPRQSWWREIVLTDTRLAEIRGQRKQTTSKLGPCAWFHSGSCIPGCGGSVVSHRASPLCVLMSFVLFDRVAADCSVCCAVIWTPSCCWRANTTSAPCCCTVRGTTSLSPAPETGRNPLMLCFGVIRFNCWEISSFKTCKNLIWMNNMMLLHLSQVYVEHYAFHWICLEENKTE